MNKNATFVAISMFVMILFLSLTSATIEVRSVPSKLSQTDNYFTIEIKSNVNETVNVSASTINSNDESIVFIGEEKYVVNGTWVEFNITYDASSFNFELGEDYSTTVSINGSNSSAIDKTLSISFEKTNYCGIRENKNKISVDIDDVKVSEGFGEDDDYWYLMDEIEVDVIVKNDGSYDLDNVEVEWALYTTSGRKIFDDTEKDFKLRDGDDKTVTFSFKIDEDLDRFDGEDAILYVRAIGETDDKDSSYDGEESCGSDSVNVDVITKDDFVVVDELRVNDELVDGYYFNESFECGSYADISGRLYNIGEDDQDDVSLEIYSKALGVYEKIKFDTIDAYDYREFSYRVNIPEEMDEGNYEIRFEVYDEDNDLFENKEDDKAVFTNIIKVDGKCKLVAPSVSAKLVGDALSGEEVGVVATIENLGEDELDYLVVPEGYSEWATMTSFSPEVFRLAPGEAKNVTINLKLKKDALGEKSFSLTIMNDNRIAGVQPISMNVEKGSFDISDIKDYATADNLKVAGIILLNIILLIAIISVSRKIIRRK